MESVETVVRRRIAPEERILWVGQPDVRSYALAGAWYLIPFSLLWGGFAIFWEVSVIASGAPIFFVVWGIPFVLIGLYLIFGRIVVALREARRTIYAVTDRRVLARTGAFSETWTEMSVADLPTTTVSEGGGGIGTITFGPAMPFSVPPGWPTMGMWRQSVRFVAIPQAADVSQIVQRARDEAREQR